MDTIFLRVKKCLFLLGCCFGLLRTFLCCSLLCGFGCFLSGGFGSLLCCGFGSLFGGLSLLGRLGLFGGLSLFGGGFLSHLLFGRLFGGLLLDDLLLGFLNLGEFVRSLDGNESLLCNSGLQSLIEEGAKFASANLVVGGDVLLDGLTG